ncbi:MAG TPA: sigma-70 family RNA polymerase sigma factor [Ilumatobacteraceae bacterium]|nr:sigma-70 family RNA polymerase sigma factor [Ilumatobacteraceae bacterium]
MVRRPPTTLDAACRGDRDALGELWRTHQASLLRYLRARRAPSPDDLASQVWIDIARSIDRFEGDAADFRRWMFTIAHRRSVDEIRRLVRRTDLTVRAADHVAGADVELDCHTALDRAIALVSTLPDNLAEAVMLRVVNDLPIADVASVMGTTEGNVRVLVHRGLTRLRRKISVTDDVPQAMKGVP